MIAYNDDFFAPFKMIGGNGGQEFEFYGGTDGVLLAKIGVWAGEWQIKAIEVTLTNGETQTFGKQDDGGQSTAYPYQEYIFKQGETMTQLSLWGNGEGSRCGAIKFSTSLGHEFDHGMTKWGRQQEYPIEIGSGICCGVFGKSDADIDSLGFAFLRPIKRATLKDVEYDIKNRLAVEHEDLEVRALQTKDFVNEASETHTSVLGWQEEVEHKYSWSVSSALEFSMEVTVSASIFTLFQSSGTFQWKLGLQGTYGQEHTESITIKNEERVSVPPYSLVTATALVRTGHITTGYTGTLEVEVDSGKTFEYSATGMYEGINFSGAEVEVEQHPLPVDSNTPEQLQLQNA